MKKLALTVVFLVVGLVCILAAVNKSQAVMNKSIYDFKNAEITLETTAPMSKTTQKVSVGERGKYVKDETTTQINAFGIKRNEVQVTYTDRAKDMVYTYDPKANEATAMDISEMMEGAKKNNAYAFNKESLEKWGGKILREETYKGLKCTVVEFTNFMSTVWFHKKYPVRMVANAAGMEIITELISFKEGAAKDYKLPSSAKITETQNMGDIMGQMQAYKNSPDYQERQNQKNNEYDPENMADIQKAMDEAGPEMQDAMKALSTMFGN